MKTKKNIIFLSLILVAFFYSCEYEIDYNEKLPEDKFVFSTFIEENDSIRMTIMHSAKPGIYVDFSSRWEDIYNFNFADCFVQNAEVSLWINGLFKEKKIQENYPEIVFDYLPQHNDKITLKIEHEKYSTIEQELLLNFSPVEVDSFSVYRQVIEGCIYLTVYIVFTDDGEENYYMFTPSLPLNKNDQKLLYESSPNTYAANFISIDDLEQTNDVYNRFGVFSNKNFKGKKYAIKLAYGYDGFGQMQESDYSFSISKIDVNAYNYLRTLGNTLDSYGPIMNPVIIQNAFKDAYGFISKKKTIVLPVIIENNL